MLQAERLQRLFDIRAGLWRFRLAGWVGEREAAERVLADCRRAVAPSSPAALAVWGQTAAAREERLATALAARARAQRGVDASLDPLRQATASARSAEHLARRRAVARLGHEAAAEAQDREAWDAARRVIQG
jgi:hypothetical protein